jgi:preprotein translocase subunit SecE
MSWQERVSSATQFLREVRQELRKVTWPKREEVLRATLMTLVATVIIAIYLGFTDFILQNGFRPLFTGGVNLWTLVMMVYFGGLTYLIYLTTRE